jgi:hypothetical protein
VRENRTHGSEGGERNNLPDPYREMCGTRLMLARMGAGPP